MKRSLEIYFESLEQVWKEELQVIRRRRNRLFSQHRPDREESTSNNEQFSDPSVTLVGLSLSGGGIRSGLFNLGVLQGLSRLGILKLVDILSTVSGGGYIGGCLSALLSIKDPDGKELNDDDLFTYQEKDKPLFSTSWERFPLRDSFKPDKDYKQGTLRCGEVYGPKPFVWSRRFDAKDEMNHLRNHSNYLLPGGSHFFTMFRSAGALILNFLGPFFWFTSLILWTTAMYMAVISMVSEMSHSYFTFDTSSFADALHFLRATLIGYPSSVDLQKAINLILASISTLFIISATSLPVLTGKKREVQFFPSWFGVALALNLFILTSIVLQAGQGSVLLHQLPLFLLDPLCVVGLNIVVVFVVYAASTLRCAFGSPRYRSFLYLIGGSQVIMLIYALFFALVPFMIKIASGVVVPVMQVFLAFCIKYLLGGEIGEQAKQSLFRKYLIRFKELFLNLSVSLFVLLFVISAGCFLDRYVWDGDWLFNTQMLQVDWLGFSKVLIMALLMFWGLPLFNFNRLSNHYFYRDRLSDAFLTTSLKQKNSRNGSSWLQNTACIVRNLSEMKMSHLHGVVAGKHKRDISDSVAAMGPYHIINATLNLTGSHELAGLKRKTEPFIFSRLFTGSERTGYIRTADAYPGLSLARAITTSGAAVAPIMGKMTTRFSSFACTILGMRLGLWIKNPKWLFATIKAHDFDGRNHKKSPKDLDKIRYWMRPLFRELTGSASAEDEIYISDGGHCGDNLGIVPLLKRRAKLVIASDSECDPDYFFNSLNSSLRCIFVDEGIKIDMATPPKAFDKDSSGYTKSHFMIGRILYPDRPWQASWLIVLKSSVNGDELTPILNYKKKCPDFPHETTANQFFTEEQFEAYRALGRHIAYDVFKFSRSIKDLDKRDPWMCLDLMCRILWEEQQKQLDDSKNQDRHIAFQHHWDDLLGAMWDCEHVDFSSWRAFYRDVCKMVKEAKHVKSRDVLVHNLFVIKEWLDKCFENGESEQQNVLDGYKVPKNLMDFCKLQSHLASNHGIFFTRCEGPPKGVFLDKNPLTCSFIYPE